MKRAIRDRLRMPFHDLGFLFLIVAVLAHFISMPLINWYHRITSKSQMRIEAATPPDP